MVSRSLIMRRRGPKDVSLRQLPRRCISRQQRDAVSRQSGLSHQHPKDDTLAPPPIEPAILRNRHKPFGSRNILYQPGMATAGHAPECARPSRNMACPTFRNADKVRAAEARNYMRLENITCSQSVPAGRKAYIICEARYRLATSISRYRSSA